MRPDKTRVDAFAHLMRHLFLNAWEWWLWSPGPPLTWEGNASYWELLVTWDELRENPVARMPWPQQLDRIARLARRARATRIEFSVAAGEHGLTVTVRGTR